METTECALPLKETRPGHRILVLKLVLQSKRTHSVERKRRLGKVYTRCRGAKIIWQTDIFRIRGHRHIPALNEGSRKSGVKPRTSSVSKEHEDFRMMSEATAMLVDSLLTDFQ